MADGSNNSDLAEKLDSAAFELEHAANQLRYSANDVRKNIQLSPPMYEYVTQKSLGAMRAILSAKRDHLPVERKQWLSTTLYVRELRRKIDEYQDTFKAPPGPCACGFLERETE